MKGSSRFRVGGFSQFWQHAGEDFQSQVFLIAEAIGAPLDRTNLVVEALDKPQGDLVLGLTVGHDAVPMSLDHAGEPLEGLQALPAQGRAPVVEEAPRPAWAPVVPELIEGLLESGDAL
jgi:hypothetical protein